MSISGLSDFTFFLSSWDEWVPNTRLLKYNEANLSLQKDLSRAQAAATSTSASTSKTSNAARGAQAGGGRRKEGGRGTKRGRDDDDGTRRPEMRLVVPDTLKVLLVDDWEAVTKNNQVRSLLASTKLRSASPVGHAPQESHCRRYTRRIQATYSKLPPAKVRLSSLRLNDCTSLTARSRSPSLRDPQVVLPTIVSGLQVYFDKALGSNLLYRFERPQYADIRKRYVTGPTVQVSQEREMSSIYGAEHLLRMIGPLPLPPITEPTANSRASEFTSDGGGVYYGPRECRFG
jgi:mortality factor 4-like protein 1